MPIDYLAHIRDEADRFRAAVVRADPTTQVPACPEWTTDDLLWHVGGDVIWFWATIVRDRLTDPRETEASERARPGDHEGLLACYDESVTALVTALEQTPDGVEVWTWSRNHTVGFIRRRMAHEALIHRLDAELTAGAVTGVDADFATDGVDELLAYFFCGPSWSQFTADGPVGLLRTLDTGAEWFVQLGSVTGSSPDGERSYDREPAFRVLDADSVARLRGGSPTFTLSAGARDLDAWLWRRPTEKDVVVDGSDADFARFTAIVAEGI